MLQTRSYGSVEITSVDRPALLAALSERARRLSSDHPEVEEVLLFGSFARGDYTPASDVDLLIIVTSTEVPFLKRADPYRDIFASLPFDVWPLVYTRTELDRMKAEGNSFILTALADAIRL
ncbi:MAG TPA: nucleotidyltransferase domain-containing protein [Thermoanaerobaculia bacterium]